VKAAVTACPDCGLIALKGQPDCGEFRNLLVARDFEQPVLYWQYHRLAIDAYCVQHAAYVQSAKSLAAHLCALCIALERNNDSAQMRGLQRWLSTNPAIGKPALPDFRGDLTIKDVWGITDPDEYGNAVEGWARSAWEAYRELHFTAREWLKLSIEFAQKRG
jgi:hypothetical protein